MLPGNLAYFVRAPLDDACILMGEICQVVFSLVGARGKGICARLVRVEGRCAWKMERAPYLKINQTSLFLMGCEDRRAMIFSRR